MVQHGHFVNAHLFKDPLSPSHREDNGDHILAVNMFSLSTDVTSAEVYNSIKMTLSNCSSSMAHCRMVPHHQLTYQCKCYIQSSLFIFRL